MRLQLKRFKYTHNCKHFYMCMAYLIHCTHIPSNQRLSRHTYIQAFNLTTKQTQDFSYIPYATIQKHVTSRTYTCLQFKHFKTHNFTYIPRLSFKHFTDMYIHMPSVQTLHRHVHTHAFSSNTSQTCTYTCLQFKHFTDMYIHVPSVQTLHRHVHTRAFSSNTSQTCTYTCLQFKHFTDMYIHVPSVQFTDMYIHMPSVQTLHKYVHMPSVQTIEKHACRV